MLCWVLNLPIFIVKKMDHPGCIPWNLKWHCLYRNLSNFPMKVQLKWNRWVPPVWVLMVLTEHPRKFWPSVTDQEVALVVYPLLVRNELNWLWYQAQAATNAPGSTLLKIFKQSRHFYIVAERGCTSLYKIGGVPMGVGSNTFLMCPLSYCRLKCQTRY